ncbi:MAG: molecular chaperone HtpG [Rickettsiales bacterium]|jgi:molecular chaperone HtpG|nr:molecular chaperone HtpG [Rickettsiales bacterium]
MTTKTKAPATETRKFDAEVGKILHLMIHSLYTNKDIFLRELISNASDACDKLRYQAITKPELLADAPELHVTLEINKKARTLTITDTGIGMNREELIDQLGTIARSGTQRFVENISGDSKKDIQLIGQFGVGFYSSFMVADRVKVISRKAGETQAFAWESDGTGEFTIQEAEGDFSRGTRIELHLRENMDDYLDKHRIKHIATTYSDHISLPILFIDEDDKQETLNKASALWTRAKSDVTQEQYNEFYRHVSHSGDEPWLTIHQKAEGALEYTTLLFIPTMKPFDLYHPDRARRVKLYVRRVYITDEGIDLIPTHMRFIRGIVDSEDLPLNISRESLQHNATIHRIKKAVAKKVYGELKTQAANKPEEFKAFWENFGPVMKEGLCDAMEDRDAIFDVCRFRTTRSDGALVSLDEYIARMKPGQNQIYYLTGDSIESMMKSPQIEGFLSKDIEVLLLSDAVDDFWVNVNNDYKEKGFCSVTRSGIDLDNLGDKPELEEDAGKTTSEKVNEKKNKIKEKEESLSSEDKELVHFFRETLKDKISDVRISNKLTASPVCLAVGEYGMDIRMERFLVEQKQLPKSSAKILELNPKHPIIQKIYQTIAKSPEDARAKDAARLLFERACIVEGEHIPDPRGFSERLDSFLSEALSVEAA